MTQPIHPVLERVARAIANGNSTPDWYAAHDPEPWLSMARAAIQALLEPDEGMVEAGEDAMIYPDGDFIRNQAETVYQAMLRPLIGEGE